MIVGVFGLPGMGKTTFLTKLAYKCLHGRGWMGFKHHDIVFTNFECQGCYKLDFSTLGVYQYENALILIDEIMLLADTRNFKTFPAHLKYFFAMHRHHGLEICWASQYYDDCDKKIRVLTDRYYIMSALGKFTIVKPIDRRIACEGGKILDDYQTGNPISWRWVFRPHYYKYFDSFAHADLPQLPQLELWECIPQGVEKL